LTNLGRRKALVAFALADNNPVALLAVRPQVDPILPLAPFPVDLARRDIRLSIQQVTTQLLKNIFPEIMKRREITWTNAGRHHELRRYGYTECSATCYRQL
jgi:hypothetical protein